MRREAEALRDAGFDVDVICLRQPGGEAVEDVDGVRLYRVRAGRRRGGKLRYLLDYAAFFILAGMRVTRLHLRHPYRLIQVNTMPDFLVFATFVPKLLGAKVAVFMKEPSPELGATLFGSGSVFVKALRLAERLTLRYADVALTVTDELRRTLIERGADPDKLHVVLNCPDYRHLAGPAVDHDTDRFTLICHGTIEERYGHADIVEAAAIARKAIPGLRVWITGEGSFAGDMVGLVDKLDLRETVEFLGWLSHDELLRRLRSADAGIVAQRANPYAHLVHTNKMFEYIMLDMPVIASRLRAVAAAFGDDSLWFFQPNDSASLASAIEGLWADPERGRALVRNARRLYETSYSWDHQRGVYLDVCLAVIAP